MPWCLSCETHPAEQLVHLSDQTAQVTVGQLQQSLRSSLRRQHVLQTHVMTINTRLTDTDTLIQASYHITQSSIMQWMIPAIRAQLYCKQLKYRCWFTADECVWRQLLQMNLLSYWSFSFKYSTITAIVSVFKTLYFTILSSADFNSFSASVSRPR